MVEVELYKIPLSNKIEDIRAGLINDPRLEQVVRDYAEELAKQDIETWLYDRNMIVTEKGYIVAIFKEEKSLLGTQDNYIEMCEKVIHHLISTIQINKLYEYFNKDILNDALLIRSMLKNKADEKAS